MTIAEAFVVILNYFLSLRLGFEFNLVDDVCVAETAIEVQAVGFVPDDNACPLSLLCRWEEVHDLEGLLRCLY